MTALNFVNAGRRAFILQDTAVLNEKRNVCEFVSKCLPCPEVRGAIASSGPAFLTGHARRGIVQEFSSIDDLAERGEHFFKPFIAGTFEQLAAYGWPWMACEVLVVGWSDLYGAVRAVYYGRNLDELFWTTQPSWLSPFEPGLHDAARRFYGAIAAAGGNSGFDPVEHGIPFLEAQRNLALVTRKDSADAHHTVGGAVEVTEITETGTASKIIHRWPEDVIGTPIRPRRTEDA